MAELKDNGTRVQYEGGALREEQTGKGRLDLLPPNAILRLAQHYEDGARKYGERNWERGMPKERFIDSGFRHLLKYMAGETDEPHLVAVVWNFICLLEYECLEQKDLDIMSECERLIEYATLKGITVSEAAYILKESDV